MTTQFNGSIVALVTPMTDDGRVDSDAYMRLLELHLECGTHGLVIGGTTGESPTLTPEEIGRLVSAAASHVGGRIPVIAGSGTNSTAGTIALTRRACDAGADACLVVTPYYNRPTQDGLRQHFEAVAGAATVPLILYNVPARTGCDLQPATVARLAADPGIVAIKEATGEVARAAALFELCGDAIDVLSGDDLTALALMRAGATGVISVTANVAARDTARLCTAALAGDFERAAAIDERLKPLQRALFVEPNPIPVKHALHRMGLIGPTLRLPLTPLEPEHRAVVVEALRTAGLEVARL